MEHALRHLLRTRRIRIESNPNGAKLREDKLKFELQNLESSPGRLWRRLWRVNL